MVYGITSHQVGYYITPRAGGGASWNSATSLHSAHCSSLHTILYSYLWSYIPYLCTLHGSHLQVSQAHQLHVTQDLLELLEEQVADLMHLRHLYLTKRALLALQRKALIHSLASFDSQLVHPSDNSATAEEVAAHLKDIAFEDQAVLYRIARAVWVGVSVCICSVGTLYHFCLVLGRLSRLKPVHACGFAARQCTCMQSNGMLSIHQITGMTLICCEHCIDWSRYFQSLDLFLQHWRAYIYLSL